MNGGPGFVLDASALLAYLWNEPGGDEVRASLREGIAISAVNWAEVLSKLADYGSDPHTEAERMLGHGALGKVLGVVPLDDAMASEIAHLRHSTRSLGLSLGDRACLALGRRLAVPVLTADRSWKSLKLGVRIQPIR